MAFYNRQEKGKPLAIYDEGVLLTSSASSIDFTGAGISGSIIGTAITENIPGGSGTSVVGETPTGNLDGANLTYTLAHTPIAGTFQLFYGKVLSNPGDYSLSGTTITMTYPLVPGDTFQANYSY